MNASSPGYAVIFVMMGVSFAAAAMLEERRRMTLARILTTPTKKFSIISGKMFGFFLIGFIQFLVLILFGEFVLKVNWGNSPIWVLLLTISYVLAVTGIGMLFSVFARTYAQASALATLIAIVTSMLGGSWWPIEIVTKFMQDIALFTPRIIYLCIRIDIYRIYLFYTLIIYFLFGRGWRKLFTPRERLNNNLIP